MSHAFLAAMQLADSAAPTGAFSHSLGFETYLSEERIHDENSFNTWMRMFIQQQLTFTDALAIRRVYAATNFDEVAQLDAELTALTLPEQIRKAGATMGQRLLSIGLTIEHSEWGELYREGINSNSLHGHQASVWAVLTRSMGIEGDTAVTQHLYSTVISLTQNAVRAVPLGQNSGQRIIADMRTLVLDACERSKNLDACGLGAVAPGLEIAQMRHERQQSRLFMS